MQEDTVRASEAADMWALGLLAFEILAGQPLFHEDLSDETIGAMLAGCALSRYLAAAKAARELQLGWRSESC